jgi:DNA-binding MarR family transcriptional regulator
VLNQTGNDRREDEIVDAIRKLMRAVDSHSRRLKDEFGLTAPQLFVLRELARQGEVTAGQLARAVHFGQPTVKVILDRLEELGLVTRGRDEQDRRSLRIRLTDPGREVVERAPHLLQESFRGRFRRLDPWEREMIVSVMQRVASMMEVDTASESPSGDDRAIA